MRKKTLKTLSVLAALSLATLTIGCGSGDSTAKDEKTAVKADTEEAVAGATEQKIIVGGNITPHTEILYEAQKILKEEGIDLEVVEIEDSVTPNTGVVEGSLDANYFQHVPYLENYNEENGTDLVSIGAIHYEPFGVYSKKLTDLSELADEAKIAVPNNPTNEARALLLLEQEGIITLNDGVGVNATIQDIKENPKNVSFVEIDPAQLVNALPDVDIAVINGNYALEGGLSVGKDALAVEANDGLAATTYGNIIATKAENKDNPLLKRLVEVLQSEEISTFINESYDGAVVPLN